jgi:D-inositol-3-phosphate glycosyltransferase
MRLLWVGDGLTDSSISRVAHAILDHFPQDWEIVLYAYTRGRPFRPPSEFHYRVIVHSGEPGHGARSLREFAPDVVCFYGGEAGAFSAAQFILGVGTIDFSPGHRPATFSYQPMEVENVNPAIVLPLNQYDRIIVPDAFCARELVAAGLTRPPAVIGHGVDLQVFHRTDRVEARRSVGIADDWYVVGCVNGNYRRKRIDLTVRYFALWARSKPANVKLYYHGPHRSAEGWDVPQLCRHYGIADRLVSPAGSDPSSRVSEYTLRAIYNAMDVHISTSYGEGFGLTVAESMACGVAQIIPEHSAFSEWPRGAVHHVECTSVYTAAGGEQDGQNTIGHIADEAQFIDALDRVYLDGAYRARLGQLAEARIREDRFRWKMVASRFADEFRQGAKEADARTRD